MASKNLEHVKRNKKYNVCVCAADGLEIEEIMNRESEKSPSKKVYTVP